MAKLKKRQQQSRNGSKSDVAEKSDTPVLEENDQSNPETEQSVPETEQNDTTTIPEQPDDDEKKTSEQTEVDAVGESTLDDTPTDALDLDQDIIGSYETPTPPSEPVDANKASVRSDSESFHLAASPELPPRSLVHTIVQTGPSGSAPESTTASLLLAAKQSDMNVRFGTKNAAQQSAINSGTASIRKTFADIKNTIGHMAPELLGTTIDWPLWTRVVDNYEEVVLTEPETLQNAVTDGIPQEFRGIVWQLVARSKNLQLEELYMHLKSESSEHERAIKRDLTRTSFYTNVCAASKADEMYNVIKAYSLFDPDVGYTQGMAFIAVPLVMNMTEAECFCLLVTLMKDYGLRDLFCPDMHGLHLLLHQFDRVLEQCLPLLYNHLVRQGVRLLMYASQWFLTFFSYKFPLDVVLRIFDMVITQGIEVVVLLAVNLMLRNETSLLRLNFDSLLEFLKLSLFNVYVSDEFVGGPEKEAKRFSILRKSPSKQGSHYYKLDAFVHDAMQITISPADLLRYKLEFDLMCQKDKSRLIEIEVLKVKNGLLRHEIKKLEMDYLTLNKDHISVVQNLVDTKVALPEVMGDIEELQETVATLEADVRELESKVDEGTVQLPQNIDTQIQDLLTQNALETERFANLEDQLSQLTFDSETLDAELKQHLGKKWFGW